MVPLEPACDALGRRISYLRRRVTGAPLGELLQARARRYGNRIHRASQPVAARLLAVKKTHVALRPRTLAYLCESSN
jgi:hypothetical protein